MILRIISAATAFIVNAHFSTHLAMIIDVPHNGHTIGTQLLIHKLNTSMPPYRVDSKESHKWLRNAIFTLCLLKSVLSNWRPLLLGGPLGRRPSGRLPPLLKIRGAAPGHDPQSGGQDFMPPRSHPHPCCRKRLLKSRRLPSSHQDCTHTISIFRRICSTNII